MPASKNARAGGIESLSTLERLILAQAVFEFGSNKWDNVSAILSKHPLLHRPKNYFTSEYCNEIYVTLMKDAALELPDPERSRRAPATLHLAQIHYMKRMQEIRTLLSEEEAHFRKLVGEIDLIRAGKWDDQIRAELTGEPIPVSAPAPEPITRPHVEPAEPEPMKVPSPTTTTSEDNQLDSSQIVEQMLVDRTSISVSVEAENALPEIEEQHEQIEVVPQEQQAPPKSPSEGPIDVSKTPSPEIDVTEEPAKDVSRSSSPKVMESVEEPQPTNDIPAELPSQTESAMDVDVDTAPIAQEKESSPDVTDVPTTIDQDIEMVAIPRASPSHEGEFAKASTSGKRKTSEALSEPPRERKRLREDSEQPDEEEPGPSLKGRRKAQGGDKKFQNVIGMLHSTISQHRYGNIFHNPIKKSEAADYADLVKRPMDLKTIKARVKDGVISNSLEFQRDVYLMFANAMMYNRPGSEIYNMAEEMMLESEIQINNFRQTEGFHHK